MYIYLNHLRKIKKTNTRPERWIIIHKAATLHNKRPLEHYPEDGQRYYTYISFRHQLSRYPLEIISSRNNNFWTKYPITSFWKNILWRWQPIEIISYGNPFYAAVEFKKDNYITYQSIFLLVGRQWWAKFRQSDLPIMIRWSDIVGSSDVLNLRSEIVGLSL